MKAIKNDPVLQGEGNITAARRVRKAAETFVAQRTKPHRTPPQKPRRCARPRPKDWPRRADDPTAAVR